MRLAVVSYGLPTPGRRRGGVDRVAHDLAAGLARRGHAVTVFSHDDAPPGAPYARQPLPGASLWRNPLGKRLTMGWLGHVLLLGTDFGDVDAVLAHGDSLLLPLRGRPVLRVMHGSAWAEARSARSPWRWLSQMGIYGTELLSAVTQPGRVVAVSANTRRDFGPFIRADRVVPNGVDLAAFPPAGPGEKSAQPSVAFVGVHGGRKRGGLLLRWFAEHVRPRFPAATLDFVGPSGPTTTPAAAGVHYHTDIPGEELAALLRRAWVYASPSVYEGFGLPYLEAMASGTPVLATPNPGSREVLAGGVAGVLAEDAAFPGELVRLLADAGERARLTAAGLARARELSLEKTVDRYDAILGALGRLAKRPMTNDQTSAGV